jgi:hypothetical protein
MSNSFRSGFGKKLLVLILLLAVRPGFGQIEYTVKGTIKDSWFKAWSPELQQVKQYRFEVFVKGKQWRIDLFQTDVTNNIVRRTVGSEDGTNIIHLEVNNRGSSFVLVEPEVFPVGKNVPAFVHLWLTYASSPYFVNRTGNRLPPIYEYAYYNNRPKMELPEQKASFVIGDGLPRLPQFLTFFAKNLESTSHQQTDLSSSATENFYTNAVYETSEFQRAGKLQLPGRMRFQYFLPNSDDNHLSVLYSSEAQVDSVSDKCSEDAISFPLPRRFVAKDLRLENEGSIGVARQNGSSSLNKPVSYTNRKFTKVPTLDEFAKFQSTSRSVLEAKRRFWMLVFFAFINLAFLSFLVIRSVLRRKRPESSDYV